MPKIHLQYGQGCEEVSDIRSSGPGKEERQQENIDQAGDEMATGEIKLAEVRAHLASGLTLGRTIRAAGSTVGAEAIRMAVL
jgi:hypothetical protein